MSELTTNNTSLIADGGGIQAEDLYIDFNPDASSGNEITIYDDNAGGQPIDLSAQNSDGQTCAETMAPIIDLLMKAVVAYYPAAAPAANALSDAIKEQAAKDAAAGDDENAVIDIDDATSQVGQEDLNANIA